MSDMSKKRRLRWPEFRLPSLQSRQPPREAASLQPTRRMQTKNVNKAEQNHKLVTRMAPMVGFHHRVNDENVKRKAGGVGGDEEKAGDQVLSRLDRNARRRDEWRRAIVKQLVASGFKEKNLHCAFASGRQTSRPLFYTTKKTHTDESVRMAP